MATMPVCMPVTTFDAVENNVQFVSSGLSLAQKMNVLRRVAFSLVTLTFAFRQTVREQDGLLVVLNEALRDNNLPPKEQLIFSAEKLESIAATNERIKSLAESLEFRPWQESLLQMERQAERFHCIAETLRMNADAAMKSHISDLIESAARESTEAAGSDWREFVGSLQD